MRTTTSLTIYFICHITLALPYQLEINLSDYSIPEYATDYNLCQIFEPLSIENDNKIFTNAVPNSYSYDIVRYIVLHKCQWSTNQKQFYQPFLNHTYKCEDTKYVEVRKV